MKEGKDPSCLSLNSTIFNVNSKAIYSITEAHYSSVFTIIHQVTTWFQTWKRVVMASVWLLRYSFLIPKISFYIIILKEKFENKHVIQSSFIQNALSILYCSYSKGKACVSLGIQHYPDFVLSYDVCIVSAFSVYSLYIINSPSSLDASLSVFFFDLSYYHISNLQG